MDDDISDQGHLAHDLKWRRNMRHNFPKMQHLKHFSNFLYCLTWSRKWRERGKAFANWSRRDLTFDVTL